MTTELSATVEGDSDLLGTKCTRLHITPFNPTLLTAIIPATILQSARNISFHTLQSFPEKEFGFVDLPAMEAEKLKKRLNGSTLRGVKVKIEEARTASKTTSNERNDAAMEIRQAHIPSLSKKRKREKDTLSGFELQNRLVKRGWTDPKPHKKRETRSNRKEETKSKYTTGPECLFRTTLPANVAAAAAPVAADPTGKVQRKKGKSGKNIVVHEFARTTKHAAFLRAAGGVSGAKIVSKFVEGIGWMDHDGNVVDVARSNIKADPVDGGHEVIQHESFEVSNKPEDQTSESDSIIQEDEYSSSSAATTPADLEVEDSPGSDGGIPLDREDTSGPEEFSTSSVSTDDAEQTGTREEPRGLERLTSSSSARVGLLIEIPKSPSSPSLPVPAVHPLEALYKRRKPDVDRPIVANSLPSFSFFDDDGDVEESNDGTLTIPMTPFTQQDIAHRELRSAAPTPDTAHPGRKYTWPTDMDAPDQGHDPTDGVETPSRKRNPQDLEAENDTPSGSDFQKWFYEHRGETNRAWKARKKVAAKEKRQRENRKRGERSH